MTLIALSIEEVHEFETLDNLPALETANAGTALAGIPRQARPDPEAVDG